MKRGSGRRIALSLFVRREMVGWWWWWWQEKEGGGGRSWGIRFCEGWIRGVVGGLVGGGGYLGGSGGICSKKIRDLVKSLFLFSIFLSSFSPSTLTFLACASGICMQLKRGKADPR